MHAPVAHSSSFVDRWWTYQRERFPVFSNGALILSFSFCAVSYSHRLRGEQSIPAIGSVVVAFLTCFLFFLQLRIADEFKDHEEDSRYRPYRPVPRGLVTLRELGWLFAGAALVQLLLALWLAPAMVQLLLIPWIYLAGMSREFFVRDWLKARPITYLWSHMLIMPLVDFYATGCDWLAQHLAAPHGLYWFLAASFFNGIVIEVGRKLRAPGDEEFGVQTYTVLWGVRRAPIVWLGILLAAGMCAVAAAVQIGAGGIVAVVLGAVMLACIWQVWRFSHASKADFEWMDQMQRCRGGSVRGTRTYRLRSGKGRRWWLAKIGCDRRVCSAPPTHLRPAAKWRRHQRRLKLRREPPLHQRTHTRGKHSRPGSGKSFEVLSGIWTLALYGSLGGVPLIVR